MMTEDAGWHGEDARDHNDKSKKKIMHMFLNGKSKIMASVYNIYRRHPSNPAPFSLSPIVLLGRCYACINDTPNSSTNPLSSINRHNNNNNSSNSNNNNAPHVARFLKDYESLLWFSYRKDFPPIGPAEITSDIGWGCMLRTGQMMLAEALIFHLLGREWRLGVQDLQPSSVYRQILQLFVDAPGSANPFSIHNIVSKNKAMTPTTSDADYKGEVWFSPSVIAKVLRSLVHAHAPDSFAMYVPTDGVVCIDKVVAVCTQVRDNSHRRFHINDINIDSGEWRSVLILVPIRLGLEKLNPIYYRAISECLKMPQTVGIIGGKPKQSFYFVGFQDEYLVFLDPHIVHEVTNPDKDFSNETYHCRAPQKIHISEVDPSLAVGFYCRDKADFDDFCATIKRLEQEMDFIFSVVDQQPVYDSDEEEMTIV